MLPLLFGSFFNLNVSTCACVCVSKWLPAVRARASVRARVRWCGCECECAQVRVWVRVSWQITRVKCALQERNSQSSRHGPRKTKKKQNFILASLLYPATPSCCRPHLGKLGGNAGMCVCVRANFLSNLLNASCSSLVTLLFIHSVATATACWTFRRKGKQNSPRKTMWIPKYPLVKIPIGKASKQVHRENFDVLIWVKNILKNRTTFFKLKIFCILLESSLIGGIYIVYLNN